MATTASSFTHVPFEFRTGKVSSAISSSSGLLASTQYEPAKQELTLVCPRPDSERGTGSRYSWAHSGFAYNVVVAVQGGAPPFQFVLESGPSGATLTAEAPSWNPYLYLWGRINWPSPSGTGTFKVRIYDQDGNSRLAQWTCVTDNTKFRFLDASSGSNSNNGILVADGGTGPWQTVNAWTEALTTDTGFQDLICVYRTGTYVASAGYGGTTALTINSSKPRAHIRYPGEDPIIDLDGANIVCGGTQDCYFAVATVNSPTENNPKLFNFGSPSFRVVLDRPRFSGVVSGDVLIGNDNNSCIEFAQNATDHEYVAVIDATWEDLPSNANGFSCVDWFSVTKSVIAGGTGRGLENYMGIWIKGPNDRVSVWGVDFWDESITTVNCKIHTQMASNAGSARPDGPSRCEVGYCRAYQADGSANQERTMLFGSANQDWGPVWWYRNTFAGRGGHDGGTTGVSVTIDAATGVDTSTNILTHSTGTLKSRRVCVFTTTGTLPAPLTTATRYFVIKISSTTVKLASTFADADAGNAIDITTTGSGTHTMQVINGTGEFTDNLWWTNGSLNIIDTDVVSGDVISARSALASDLSSGLLTGTARDTYYGLKGAEVASS